MVNMKRFLIGAILIAMLSAVGCSSSKPSEKLSEAASEHRTQAQSENNKETQQATIEQTTEPTTAQIVKPTAAPIELPTEKVTIPDVNFSAMDEEKGAYWLVNKIKSLGASGDNYVSSFGTTTYTLIAAYIAANPNSRFDASLKAVLAKAKEIYTVELQLKKLDDKYDYPIAKMYEYSVDNKNTSFEV